MQSERKKIDKLISEIIEDNPLDYEEHCNNCINLVGKKVTELILQEKSQSFAEGKKQGVIEIINKIDKRIEYFNTDFFAESCAIEQITEELKILKFHAEQSLAEVK